MRISLSLALNCLTLLLLVLGVGLSMGLYGLSRRVVETEARALAAQKEAQERRHVETDLADKVASLACFPNSLWDEGLPKKLAQFETMVLYVRNPEDRVQASAKQRTSICAMDLDCNPPYVLSHHLDPRYRVKTLAVNKNVFSLALMRLTDFEVFTVQLEILPTGNVWSIMEQIEHAMLQVDPNYQSQFPPPGSPTFQEIAAP